MGDLVAYSSFSERRRFRETRALHEACREILGTSVAAARLAVVSAPPAERAMRLRRLRKLEEAQAYAAAMV